MAAAGPGGDENVILTEETTPQEETITICEPHEDCPVCMENFEEENLSIVTCGCGYMVCQGCTQQYLLHTTQDPHCMRCKRAWDRTFQYEMLGSKYVNNQYKKHRKNLLLEREKARLPEAQPYVEQYKNKEIFNAQLDDVNAEIAVLREQLRERQRVRDQLYWDIQVIKNGGFVVKKEKRAFIRKCPNGDCRGFLSSSYKCDLCKVFVCSKCLEVKGVTKDDEHTCDPSNVESANMIKKETRPCPKCAVPIFKISGCDQMWCTQCQVAFSWKTGTIDQGRVHNPHFYQYMQNNDNVVRAPGEEVCGGLPGYYSISRRITRCGLSNTQWYTQSMTVYRGLIHIQRVVIDRIREKLNQAQDNLDLRVKYLANDVDESYVAKYAAQRDNIRQKNTAMLHVLELYNVVMTEQLNRLFNEQSTYTNGDLLRDGIDDMVKSANDTIAYCNKEMEKISQNYKMKVHIINPETYCTNDKMSKF